MGNPIFRTTPPKLPGRFILVILVMTAAPQRELAPWQSVHLPLDTFSCARVHFGVANLHASLPGFGPIGTSALHRDAATTRRPLA